MNPEAKRVLELGLCFACVVIILDVLLIQIPTFDWFALGLTFSLVAAVLLGSIARSVSWQRQKPVSISRPRNELEHLADIIDATAYAGDASSSRILFERISEIALGAVAGQTRLSKGKILELAENSPEELRAIVRDDEIMKFITGYRSSSPALSEKGLEEMLSKIQGWSL